MKRSFLKLLPFIFALQQQGKTVSTNNESVIPGQGYGAYGYTGFIGTNKDKKKHFNRKKRGKMLKRKHRRLLT